MRKMDGERDRGVTRNGDFDLEGLVGFVEESCGVDDDGTVGNNGSGEGGGGMEVGAGGVGGTGVDKTGVDGMGVDGPGRLSAGIAGG